MDNINVYLQNSNNGFWYDHGVELGAAIVTLIAFLFTFWNINRTNKRQEIEEQKRNDRTLKMIDLVTQKQIEKLREINKEVSEKLETEPKPDYKDLYDLNIDKRVTNFYTQIKVSVTLNDVAKYIKDNELSETLINYQEKIKDMLINQHANLNLEALEKITTKLEDIEKALKEYDKLKTYTYVSNIILAEQKDKIQKELKKYEEFNELMKKLTTKLIDEINV